MNLSELSIRRPVMAWMLMAALIIFGAISFRRLGVSQLPDVDFPVVSVSLSLNGAAPEVMESQVIDPIEDSIMQIEGIRSLNSSAQQSSGSISIEFEMSRNIDEAIQEVQNRIGEVRDKLPTDLYPPTVRKSNPEDQPILWVAMTQDGSHSKVELFSYARNVIMNQFATVPGVVNVSMGGYVDPALRVWVDSEKLKKYDITANDVVTAIQNEHVEVPVGRIENSTHEANVRIMGEAQTPKEFEKIRIQNRSGVGPNYRQLPLGLIATVEEGTLDVRKKARYNGQMAIGLGIVKQHGSNAVDVAKRVRERLKEVQADLPKGYSLAIRGDNTVFIQQSVDQLNFMLFLSAILTSIVCFLFLGSWSSTFNVLLAIPTSIVGTFIALYFFGFTLNTFTLLGLSLAIGIVVDDAIMMLENIVRHRELGSSRKVAAIQGATEITFAALTATIAVVAIFLPVIFMSGVIGRYLFQYGVTVSVAVLLSLLEALTLTPMRASRYLTVNETHTGFSGYIDRKFKNLAASYQKLLVFLLRHPWKVISVAVVLFAASWILVKKIPSEMLPQQDQSRVLFRVKAKPGVSLDFTDKKMADIEAFLSKQPETDGIFSVVGGFGGDAVNQGQVMMMLVDRNKRKESQKDLMDRWRNELKGKVKGVQIIAQDMSLRGFSSSRGFPIEFVIQGPDWEKLTELSGSMMKELEKSGLAQDVNTDIQPGTPEIKIVPNRAKMAAHGVSVRSVTSTVNALIGGAVLRGMTQYPKDGHRYAIEVRLVTGEREEAAQIKDIMVRNNRSELVSLADLVDLEEKPSLMLISRINRNRAITIHGNPAAGHSQQEALAYIEKLAKTSLPKEYQIKMTGSAQGFKESFQSLIVALLLGIVVSYMVLASQFNSFIHPVSVLLALPFSFTGAFFALFITHQSINLYSMIGFILLMGIVKKNSILLVDFTNQCRSQGMDLKTALTHACPVRLRPILMTSFATVAAALPEALSLGPGSEATIPMAIAIIGGVIASTLLTLFVVPCGYQLLAKLERKRTA